MKSWDSNRLSTPINKNFESYNLYENHNVFIVNDIVWIVNQIMFTQLNMVENYFHSVMRCLSTTICAPCKSVNVDIFYVIFLSSSFLKRNTTKGVQQMSTFQEFRHYGNLRFLD